VKGVYVGADDVDDDLPLIRADPVETLERVQPGKAHGSQLI
jgi:hypothetical protein